MKKTDRQRPGEKAKAVVSVSLVSSGRKSRGRIREDASFPLPPTHMGLPTDYGDLLAKIKQRIGTERLRTVMAANSAMVMLYWDIGRLILERQEREGWGAKTIDRLSADLCEAYPDMSGLSPRNLKYMRTFAKAWPKRSIVQRVRCTNSMEEQSCPSGQVMDDPAIRLWYAEKAMEQGWSQQVFAFKLTPGYMNGKERPSATSLLRFHPQIQTWRLKFSRIHTSLISSARHIRAAKGKSNRPSSITSGPPLPKGGEGGFSGIRGCHALSGAWKILPE